MKINETVHYTLDEQVRVHERFILEKIIPDLYEKILTEVSTNIRQLNNTQPRQ